MVFMCACCKYRYIYYMLSMGQQCRHIIPINCLSNRYYYLTPEGVARFCFYPVCLCVCLSVYVCVCPANILVFYFWDIRRDIDLKFIQLYSIH